MRPPPARPDPRTAARLAWIADATRRRVQGREAMQRALRLMFQLEAADFRPTFRDFLDLAPGQYRLAAMAIQLRRHGLPE